MKLLNILSHAIMGISILVFTVGFLGLICECDIKYFIEFKAICIFMMIVSVVVGYIATWIHEKITQCMPVH